jgi:hypothetical protein
MLLAVMFCLTTGPKKQGGPGLKSLKLWTKISLSSF